MITEILESVGHVFNAVWKLISWLQRSWLTWLGLLMSIVITPIQWAIDAAIWLMDKVIGMLDSLGKAVDALRIGDMANYVNGASYFIGLADNFVPMSVVFSVISALFALWVIVQTIKVAVWLVRRVVDVIP